MTQSVIVAGARTPIGRLLGGLKTLSGSDLGGLAIKGDGIAREGQGAAAGGSRPPRLRRREQLEEVSIFVAFKSFGTLTAFGILTAVCRQPASIKFTTSYQGYSGPK